MFGCEGRRVEQRGPLDRLDDRFQSKKGARDVRSSKMNRFL